MKIWLLPKKSYLDDAASHFVVRPIKLDDFQGHAANLSQDAKARITAAAPTEAATLFLVAAPQSWTHVPWPQPICHTWQARCCQQSSSTSMGSSGWFPKCGTRASRPMLLCMTLLSRRDKTIRTEIQGGRWNMTGHQLPYSTGGVEIHRPLRLSGSVATQSADV